MHSISRTIQNALTRTYHYHIPCCVLMQIIISKQWLVLRYCVCFVGEWWWRWWWWWWCCMQNVCTSLPDRMLNTLHHRCSFTFPSEHALERAKAIYFYIVCSFVRFRSGSIFIEMCRFYAHPQSLSHAFHMLRSHSLTLSLSRSQCVGAFPFGFCSGDSITWHHVLAECLLYYPSDF